MLSNVNKPDNVSGYRRKIVVKMLTYLGVVCDEENYGRCVEEISTRKESGHNIFLSQSKGFIIANKQQPTSNEGYI